MRNKEKRLGILAQCERHLEKLRQNETESPYFEKLRLARFIDRDMVNRAFADLAVGLREGCLTPEDIGTSQEELTAFSRLLDK